MRKQIGCAEANSDHGSGVVESTTPFARLVSGTSSRNGQPAFAEFQNDEAPARGVIRAIADETRALLRLEIPYALIAVVLVVFSITRDGYYPVDGYFSAEFVVVEEGARPPKRTSTE